MKSYHHPNVLPLYTSFVRGQDLWMVTPFMSGGSILHIMKYQHPEVSAASSSTASSTVSGVAQLTFSTSNLQPHGCSSSPPLFCQVLCSGALRLHCISLTRRWRPAPFAAAQFWCLKLPPQQSCSSSVSHLAKHHTRGISVHWALASSNECKSVV